MPTLCPLLYFASIFVFDEKQKKKSVFPSFKKKKYMPNGYTEDLGIVFKISDHKANLYFLFVFEALGEKKSQF